MLKITFPRRRKVPEQYTPEFFQTGVAYCNDAAGLLGLIWQDPAEYERLESTIKRSSYYFSALRSRVLAGKMKASQNRQRILRVIGCLSFVVKTCDTLGAKLYFLSKVRDASRLELARYTAEVPGIVKNAVEGLENVLDQRKLEVLISHLAECRSRFNAEKEKTMGCDAEGLMNILVLEVFLEVEWGVFNSLTEMAADIKNWNIEEPRA